MSSDYLTPTELAERFGITEAKLHELRRRNQWPCIKFGRFDVRFTDTQVERIVAIQSGFGKPRSTGKVPGQTGRSAARSA